MRRYRGTVVARGMIVFPLPNPWRLSAREKEVFRLLLDGNPQKEIAARLALSPKTVNTYHASIRQKTGAANFVELVLAALKAGWIGMEQAPKIPDRTRPKVPGEVTRLMQTLRAEGRSYHRVARRLNELQYVTVRGKRWSATSVYSHLHKIGKLAA